MRRGFTLLEVLLAAIILGLGLTGILVAMSQSQRFMLMTPHLMPAQEVMDLGEMAYPLEEVKEEDDLDVTEKDVDDLWKLIAGEHGPRLTSEQKEKYHGFRWSRRRIEEHMNDDDRKRLNYLHAVRITVSWGSRARGEKNEETYVALWREPDAAGGTAK